ncbi:hypothetical protein CKO11_07485 [Rhodobacter sp. TJ_12]|uniref:hypothetical protein n=1 Tax=Rhodobacter sp. TJ_12 TaxID=2029399 RepID=UPI001CC04D01|nr:hypothetical protein [Rhodobacter sp. TJ_12]MBZ4022298.1 hypothetical protein [Rhodobacter sp. TJ_12]
MRRILWASAGGIALLQALFGLATLVWPAGMRLEALVERILIWQAAPLWFAQIFPGLPILVALFWRARSGLVRVLLVLSLAAALALPFTLMAEMALLHQMLLDTVAPNGALRLLGLARWADAVLGLVALIALRLAARAEALDAPPLRQADAPR